VGGLAVLGVSLGPALAVPATAAGTDYAGFTTDANSTPLRIALYEKAIPVPASPQIEANFSYTRVSAESGPTAKARASALWPGDTVGEGLKTIVSQVGLPAALAGDGYPVQVNAQSPGSPSSGSQEFFPGMVGRVQASDTGATARSGYSSSGRVGGDADDDSGATVLGQLADGDFGSLGGLLTGGATGDGTGSNPLGMLSALISVGGMSGSSTTDYSQHDAVTSSATSQLGGIELLGGLVTMSGVTVTSTSTASVGTGDVVQKVAYGGMTIAGTPFELTSDGIESDGSTTAIPDLPDDPAKALKSLGISIAMPKPAQHKKGDQVGGTARGPVITIDTQPVIKMLNLGQLPLTDLVNQMPESAKQVQGLLLAALQAHPKIVITLGQVQTDAQTVAASTIGGVNPPATSGTGTPGGGVPVGSTGVGGVPTTGDVPGGTAPTGGAGTSDAPIAETSAADGLPPLGSVPGMLVYGGIAIAALAGWALKRVAASVLGAGATCAHGLQTGLPDLREAVR